MPSTVELVDGVATAAFVAGDVPGETFVSATTGGMTGRVRIQIVTEDGPSADAGPDQQVDPGATVTLNGSGSSDPNGDALTYGWVQTGGEAVTFTPDLSITTFTAPDSAGPLTFTLTVTDATGLVDSDVTVVTVNNLAPTADAGPDQQVGLGATVTLDGSGSSDPNGDALTYGWVQTGGEAVSFAPALSITTFTAPDECRPAHLHPDRHRHGGVVQYRQHGRDRERPRPGWRMPGRTSRWIPAPRSRWTAAPAVTRTATP